GGLSRRGRRGNGSADTGRRRRDGGDVARDRQPRPPRGAAPGRGRALSRTRRRPGSGGAAESVPDGTLGRRPSLREALEPVLRNRLPRRGIRDELAIGGADSRVVVEGAEADAQDVHVLGVLAPEPGAALGAEELGEAGGG